VDLCVIGTGYVGLVTGACLASLGNRVICIDNDPDKISCLKTGKITFYEPGLNEIVKENIRKGRLLFAQDVSYGIKNSALIFITVNTPAAGDGSADLTEVFNVARDIGCYIDQDKQVIVKSTVTVGTCVKVSEVITRIQEMQNTDFGCEVAFNPEFLKEGSAVHDFMEPDRIVLGTDNPETIRLMKELYAPIIGKTACKLLIMDVWSAEITKYAANSMLATRISFVNELAKLCELTGADITKVTAGIGSDSRIGTEFLKAGLGYGGSCLPKDVKSLMKTFSDYGLNAELLKAVEQINQSQREYFVNKIKMHFGMQLSGKVLAVWGLSFKPETDDLREAPSLKVIDELLMAGAIIKAFDPLVKWNAGIQPANANLFLSSEQYAVLECADALILFTEWECFKNYDYVIVKKMLKEPVIFDGRNLFDPSELRSIGFQCYGIGRR
jgi:UDPglucose 6-dehydrogenase